MKIVNSLDSSNIRTAAGYTLLGLLIIQLYIITLLPYHWQSISYEICATIILLVLGLTLKNLKKTLLPILVSLVVLEYLSIIFDMNYLNSVLMISNILLFIVIIGIYVLQTSRATKVNAIVILQSINGYLLLAVIGGLMIIIILKSNPGAFSFPDAFQAADISFDDAQYLGLVTISTLGYGDIIPLTPIARSTTTLIAILGQLYIAIIIALLVGKFSSMRK